MKEARIYHHPNSDHDYGLPVRIRVIDFDYITKTGTEPLTIDGSTSDFFKYEVGFTVYSPKKNTVLPFWTYAYCKISDCNNLELSSILNGQMRKKSTDPSGTVKWIINFN